MVNKRLRQFRSDLSKLKRAGLVKKDLNIKSAQISTRYTKLIAKYSGVIEGRQKTLKVSRKFLQRAKEDSRDVYRGHVIVDTPQSSSVRKSVKDFFGYRIVSRDGIHTIDVPGPRGKDLEKYLTRLAKQPVARGKYVEFTFFGHGSRSSFSSIELAIDKILEYKVITDMDEDQELEVIQHIQLYEIPAPLVRAQKKSLRKKTKRKKR